MNQGIAKAERWGADEIAQRAADLAEHAVGLWPAHLAGVVRVERGRDWSLLH